MYSHTGSLIVKSSFRKLAWLILLMGSFAFLSIFCISLKPVVGWIATAFTVPFFLITLYLYRPSATFLRLNVEGFEAVSAGRRVRLKWTDVTGFHVGAVRGDKVIGIIYSEEYVFQSQNSAISQNDMEQAWIQDRYALSVEAVCKLLNDRKIASEPPPVALTLPH